MKQKPARSFPAAGLVPLLVFAILSRGASAESGTALRMLFVEKPPYSYLTDGHPDGFLIRRVRQVLDVAGVPARFEQVPAKRMFAEIRANQSPVCAMGWHRTPERESEVFFSRPIHLDPPYRILARSESAGRLRVIGRLQRIVSDATLSLAIVDGLSYGAELDRFIASFKGRVDRSPVTPKELALMVAAGRADFMFIDQADLDHLRMSDKAFARAGLHALSPADMPEGIRLHIACSHRVDAGVRERIDGAILRLLP